MKNKELTLTQLILATFLLSCTLTACSTNSSTADTSTNTTSTSSSSDASSSSSADSNSSSTLTSDGAIDTSSLFTDRDIEQEADLTDATALTLASGEDTTITEEGVYVITGSVEDTSIIVEAPDDAKVQIVLDSVSISNTDSAAIYVKTADKVFITTTDSDNSFEVTGIYTADGDTNVDAAIFSKSDLVLNGVGTLTIASKNGNGITSKDDLKVTGGTYAITCTEDGLEANDSIAICGGTFTIDTDKDALHSENDDDNTLGYIYISDGNFTINAGDDGIQGTSITQIDGGTIDIQSCVEGIEATYVIINDGTISIESSDDGINAAAKSTAYDVLVEINGGDITINMASGDTDAVDANGDIVVNGGTININGNSAFDYDNSGTLNGGTVYVNGEQITEITNSMMGGGQMGGGKGGAGGMRH